MWILAIGLGIVVLAVVMAIFGRARGWHGDADPGRRGARPERDVG